MRTPSPNLPWSKFPHLLHPGYSDTKLLFLLYPQTPLLRSLCLRNSTLRHFVPNFWFPSTKSHRPGQSDSESFPAGRLLVFLPTCPVLLPYHLGWSRKGAAPRRLPASAAANQGLPHTPPPRPIPQQRCSPTSAPGGLTPDGAPRPIWRGRPDSAPSQPGSPHRLVPSSSNPGVQIPALSPSDPGMSTA